MTESKHYHYWKDGNEYDMVVYLDDEGKGNSYGHGIRTETTMKHWQGNEFVTHEDIYGNVVYTDVRSPDGSHIEKYQDATGRWWRESIGPDGKGVRETIDEWDGDYPDDSSENVDNWHTPEEGQSPIGRISQGQGEEPSPYDGFEDENLGQDHLPPPWIEGEEDHTGGRLPLPDTGIEGEENHTGDRLPLPDDTGIQAQDNLAEGHLPGPIEDPLNHQEEERARAEEDLGPQTPSYPTPEDLGIQERYGKDHDIPDLAQEPAPAPPVPGLEVQENHAKDYGFPGLIEEPPRGQYPDPNPPAVPGGEGDTSGLGVPYEDYIPFFPQIKDPTTGEWRNAEPGEIPGLGDSDSEAQLPPGSQSPESEPPLQPTPPAGDDGGGIGIPYEDYIPFFPMVQDPTTGEWRNAEPGELEGSQSGDPNTPGSPQMLSNLFDPSAPGPTLDPDLFNPNTSGPTLDPRLLLDPDSPGPTLDPALLDPLSPGPTLDPALLDPLSPGPTLDPALLDPNEPGPAVDPSLLDPSTPGETIDPNQLEQGGVEPGEGGAELAGVAEHRSFEDPSLTESGDSEPNTSGHDLDDPSALG